MPQDMVILAVPGVQLLDVSGPLDVFTEANRILKRQVYRTSVMSTDSLTIHSSSGVRVLADRLLSEKEVISANTFLVAGAPEMAGFLPEAGVLAAISRHCLQSQRYGSICSGALLLAQTGLLKGKRVTTHWACASELARYPEVRVDADALYVVDGRLRTAAGVTSGLDLALRLVEEDLGREVALDVANNLVMFFRRPVNQTHFTRSTAVTLSGRSAFQDLLRWSTSNLQSVKTVTMMAAHINLSERHLSRLFRQELSVAPAQWLERERVAKAKLLLAQGLPAKVVSSECGFSGVDVMRRAFTRVTGMTPGVYTRFTAAGNSS
ncbi:AraC family transcriptional regulator [Erwinia sp. P7711]|uniref:GlxA family transcriptional regulator n=1 Tax=Erwinia sp. P7711 TaxID=3141451 RepID=UPI00318C117B